MPQINTKLLERLVAPGVHEFTIAEIPDVASEFPQARYWVWNHFADSMLNRPFADKDGWRQYFANLIRRAQSTLDFYSEARRMTLRYLEGNQPDNPRVDAYYRALALWEAVALNCGIALDLIKNINKEQPFVKGDGSPEARAHELSNRIKHHAEDIRDEKLRGDDLLPFWLTNQGLATKTGHLSFEEISQLVRDLGRLAEEVQNPLEFARRWTADPHG